MRLYFSETTLNFIIKVILQFLHISNISDFRAFFQNLSNSLCQILQNRPRHVPASISWELHGIRESHNSNLYAQLVGETFLLLVVWSAVPTACALNQNIEKLPFVNVSKIALFFRSMGQNTTKYHQIKTKLFRALFYTQYQMLTQNLKPFEGGVFFATASWIFVIFSIWQNNFRHYCCQDFILASNRYLHTMGHKKLPPPLFSNHNAPVNQ